MINQIHSAAFAAGRLRASGRNNQCPVCGRNKDGDCRFNHEVILCHQGTRFAPPHHLRPGDVVSVNGKPWALIRTDAGFDKAAHEFRPDRGNTARRDGKMAAPQRRVRQLSASRRLRQFNLSFREALRCPEFELLSADEADLYLPVIFKTSDQGLMLEPVVASLASHDPSWKQHLKALRHRLKTIGYQCDNARWFFGIPTTEDIAALERGDD